MKYTIALALIAALGLSGCAFTGTIDTPYGQLTSNGKTMNVVWKLPSAYAK